MKKLSWSVLGALCILLSGCDMDVPQEEIGSLGDEHMCVLSGGEYLEAVKGSNDYYCFCDGKECGKNVNCRIDESTNKPVCGGVGYTFLTEGLCTMKGVEVCAERIDKNGNAIGYYTECGDDNRWTDERMCSSGYSCKLYKFGGFAMSSKCGDCRNNGTTCVAGQITN